MAKAKLLNFSTEVIWRNNFIVLVQTDIETDNVYLTMVRKDDQYETDIDSIGTGMYCEYDEIVENLRNDGKNLVKY